MSFLFFVLFPVRSRCVFFFLPSNHFAQQNLCRTGRKYAFTWCFGVRPTESTHRQKKNNCQNKQILNLFIKSVDRICRKKSSVIGQISSTLLVGKFWARQNLSKWTDSNNCLGNYFFLSVSWICRADPKTCVLHKFCRAKWFDGKKNTHTPATYWKQYNWDQKRKDISCYMLETVQMNPIKKRQTAATY